MPRPPPSLADGLVWLALTTAGVAGVAAWAVPGLAGRNRLPLAAADICLIPVEHSDGCGPAHPARLACADGWAFISGDSSSNSSNRVTGERGIQPLAGDRTCSPSLGAPPQVEPGGMRPAWRLLAGIGLDINHVDAAALQLLPRIGPRMAERIVAYRRQHGDFVSPEQLRAVAGIGPKVWAGLAPQVRVTPPSPPAD